MSKPPSIRLDRLLANLGYGSRREVQAMAKRGRVRLDGEPIADIEARVTADAAFATRLTINGEPLDPLPGVVLMMNKPLGVTCSHREAGPLVYNLLPERWRFRDPAISTVGRLDKETSGLLLLTDDGDFLHKVISPRRHVAKRYVATLDRPLRGDEAAIFASGALMLEGEALTIMEGRYHQVRRMFAAVGNHVTALRRASMGGLQLPDDLAPGDYRLLDEAGRAAVLGD